MNNLAPPVLQSVAHLESAMLVITSPPMFTQKAVSNGRKSLSADLLLSALVRTRSRRCSPISIPAKRNIHLCNLFIFI